MLARVCVSVIKREREREREGAKMGAVVSGKIVENKWMGILKEQIFKLAAAAAARKSEQAKEKKDSSFFERRKSRRKKHF